jgi:hypothetical protein
MKPVILYPLGMIGAAAFSLIALYETLFWGWVTATPLTEAQLARAQYDAYVWFFMFVGFGLVAIVLLICWIRRRRINRTESGAAPDRSGI